MEPFTNTQAQPSGADSAGSGTAQTQSTASSSTQPAAGTQGSEPWRTSPEYQGKSTDDLSRMHYELSRKIGEHTGELGKWREYGQKVEGFMAQWQPIMERVGWDPNRLVSALEQGAKQARAQGDPASARQATEAAREVRRWAEQLTPDEQERWLEQFVEGRTKPIQDRMTAREREILTGVTQYINNFGDISLRAIQTLFNALPEGVRPKVNLHELLADAVRYSNGSIDPLDFAARMRMAPSADETREQIRKEERAKLEAELKNKELTTFVGSNSFVPDRRPLTPPQYAQTGATGNGGAAPRVPESIAMSRARDAWLKRVGPDLFPR